MPTDTERREVAARLRELPDDSTYPDLIGAIADHDGWYAAADAADRLADLIEPSPSCEFWDSEEKECYSVRTVRPVDRDALLALADEMDEVAQRRRSAHFKNGAQDIAKAIRCLEYMSEEVTAGDD